MKIIRKSKSVSRCLLALLMAITMVASFTSTSLAAGGPTFSDVPADHWAYDYVEELFEKEIMSGYGDGTFGANDNLKRGQAAKMITLARGLDYEGKVADFEDVPEGHEFSPYIAGLVEVGAIRGFGDDTFRLANNTTRSQIAQIIVKAFDLTKGGKDVTFTDLDALSVDARGYIEVLASNGIVDGYGDGRFAPNANITRAQFTKILSIAMEVAEETEVEVQELPAPRKDENASDKYALDNSNINAENLASYLNRSDVVYIDLREYEDYRASHLENFVNIPYNSYIFNVDAHTDTTKTNLYGGSVTSPISVFNESDEVLESLIPKETDKNIFFTCQSGGRVANMLRILDAKGYDTSKMYNVGGMGQYDAEVFDEFKLFDVDGTNLTDEYPTAGLSR